MILSALGTITKVPRLGNEIALVGSARRADQTPQRGIPTLFLHRGKSALRHRPWVWKTIEQRWRICGGNRLAFRLFRFERGTQRAFDKLGAMNFHRRQRAEFTGQFLGFERERLLGGLAADQFRGEAGDGNGGLAAKGLERGAVNNLLPFCPLNFTQSRNTAPASSPMFCGLASAAWMGFYKSSVTIQYLGTLESISSDQALMPPLTLLRYLKPCCLKKLTAWSERVPTLQCR